MIDVHTVGVMSGTLLSDGGKIKIGFLKGIKPFGNTTGAIDDAVLTNGGDGYTSLPVASASPGSGATFALTMAISQSTIAAAGTGYASGDQITLGAGGGTQSEANVIQVDTVSPSGGVLTYHSISDGGVFSVLPTGNLAQASTTGAGTGFSLTATAFRVATLTGSGGTSYVDQTAVTFTGGGGTGAAATISTEATGLPIETFVKMEVSKNAVIIVSPNAPATVEVTHAALGINVILIPPSGGLMPTAFDVVIFD